MLTILLLIKACRKMRGSIMLWGHMPAFSATCVCLQWPDSHGLQSLKMTRLFFVTVCARALKSLVLILKKCPEVWSAAFKTRILNSILLFSSLLSLLPYCILVPSHKSVASKEEHASNVSPQHSLSILFPCVKKHLLLTLMWPFCIWSCMLSFG